MEILIHQKLAAEISMELKNPDSLGDDLLNSLGIDESELISPNQ